jgi:ABC-type branched-subunit amino acid transport system substrate-binding protein
MCVGSALQSRELVNGKTGNVSFNDAGDRLNAFYEVVNIQNRGPVTVGNYTVNDVSFTLVYFYCVAVDLEVCVTASLS